jgi:hypothetical protein
VKTILAMLLFAVTAGAQPLILSNEAGVSQPRIGIAASSIHSAQLAATDGTNELVLWADLRGTLTSDRTANASRFFATRVDADGHVLDVPNILIDIPTILITMNVIGAYWNGHEYVVVGPGTYVRISAAGELLDPVPRTFPFTAHFGATRLAWSGSRLLIVTYVVTDDVSEMRISVYDASFNVIRNDAVVRSQTGVKASAGPFVATSGKSFVITSFYCAPVCNNDVLDVVDNDGNVLRAGAPATGVNLLASDGRSYMLLGNDNRGQLLDNLGNLIGNVGPFASDAGSGPAALAWEGDHYELVYTSSHGLAALPVSGAIPSSSTSLDSRSPSVFSTISAAGRPAARFALTDFNNDYEGYVYGSGATTTFTLGQGTLQQETPAAATIGNVSLLAWREPLSDARELYGVFAARVDSHGRPLDAAPLALGSVSCDATFPRIATSGHDYLVVWEDPNGIRAERISADGRLLDTTPVAISKNVITGCDGNQPAVVWNGSSYVIAWIGPFGAFTGLNAVRMQPDGTILDPTPIDLGRGTNFSLLHAAFDGTNAFLTWTISNNGAFEAHGTRITPDGTLLDGSGLSLGLKRSTALGFDGTNYILLSLDPDGLRSVRVTPGGQLLDFVAGLPAPAMKIPFDAATHDITCAADGCFIYAISNGALAATRFTETPAGLGVTTTTLANVPAVWKQVIPFGAGLDQVAYLRLATEQPYAGVHRLFTRQLLPARGRAVR